MREERIQEEIGFYGLISRNGDDDGGELTISDDCSLSLLLTWVSSAIGLQVSSMLGPYKSFFPTSDFERQEHYQVSLIWS